jgi:hypothetical protein
MIAAALGALLAFSVETVRVETVRGSQAGLPLPRCELSYPIYRHAAVHVAIPSVMLFVEDVEINNFAIKYYITGDSLPCIVPNVGGNDGVDLCSSPTCVFKLRTRLYYYRSMVYCVYVKFLGQEIPCFQPLSNERSAPEELRSMSGSLSNVIWKIIDFSRDSVLEQAESSWIDDDIRAQLSFFSVRCGVGLPTSFNRGGLTPSKQFSRAFFSLSKGKVAVGMLNSHCLPGLLHSIEKNDIRESGENNGEYEQNYRGYFTTGALVVLSLLLTACSFKSVSYAVKRNKVSFILLAFMLQAAGVAAALYIVGFFAAL